MALVDSSIDTGRSRGTNAPADGDPPKRQGSLSAGNTSTARTCRIGDALFSLRAIAGRTNSNDAVAYRQEL
jgi:hypothetical protein